MHDMTIERERRREMVENAPVWEDGRWRKLPPLTEDVSADVCVVGLGGSGLACVGELLGAGVDVVGVEAREVGAGAAGRNGGFLLAGACHFYHDAVRRHGHARALSLYRATLAEIERMAAETPQAVRLTGSLRIAASPEEEEDCEAQRTAMRADDLPAEAYAGPEGVGLLIPTDGALDPLLRCRTLAARALSAGARLYGGSPALTIRGDLVECPAGRIRCRRVVVAVDGGLEHVLEELKGRVRTARLQMIATAPEPQARFPRPTYFRWGLEYWQQLADGRVALGGFRDTGGESEWTHDVDTSANVQEALERLLRGRLGVRARITHRWAASAGFTPDGLPIVDEVRRGVWAIGGYSGTGNVIGAICGRAAASLAIDRPADLP